MTEEDLDSTCVKHTSYGVSLRDFLIVVATLVLGCSLSVSAYFLLDRQEKERLRFQFEHGAEHYAKAIQLEITLNIEALQRIQAVFSSGRQLDRGEFTAIVKYDLKRYPGIHGLGWAKVVKDEEVETFEQKRREEGLPDFYIGMLAADGNKVRVPKRSEYVPMVYLEPGPDGNETRIFGIDLLSEDKRASAIRSARDSGVARALRPNLARFGTNAETDFLIYLPVYQSGSFPETIEERRESLVGFAIANYYVKELIEVALREVTAITELDVFVFDTTDASDEIFLNSYSSSQSEAQVNPRISDLTSGLYWQEQINVAGRTWSIIVRPVTGYIGAKQSWQSILTLFSGIIISTLIATSLFISLRRSREKGQLLSILEQSHISLGKSEEQFRTLFESSRDALMLLNAEARVVDGNSAALKMFGYESVDELISEEVSDRSPRLQPNGLESKTLSNKMTYDVLTHGSSFSEWVYRRRDGTEFPAEVQLSRMELEGRPYFQAIIRDITERKQVEDALNDSEAKYRTLFEQSADAILIIEGDRFIDCNTATVKMLGYTSKKELLVTHPSELSPDMQSDGRNSFEKANEMISTALDQGSHRFEWDHKRRNGKVFPVEVLLTAIPIGERNFLHVVWRDITERKRTDEALRKNEKRLRDAQRIAKMGFWEVDINAATTFWSDEIYAIFGVKPDAFKPNSSSITELIHADDREYVRMAIEASLHDDIPFNIDYRILRPDGDIRYIHTQGEVIRNEAGAPLRRLGTLIDISERKQTEEALLKNHQLLSSVIEAPLDMIYVKDVDGRFLVANTALAKLLGKVKEEIIGKTNADLFPPDAADRADLEDRQVLLTGKPHTYEHTMKMDGQLRTRLSEKTVFRDHEGKILGLVGISRDITERKETEAALVKSQQLYAAAEELGRIGHWEWDYITDRLVDCSAEYARIHDLTREEMLTRYVSFEAESKMVHPDDLDYFTQVELDATEKHIAANREYRIITARGEVRHVHELGEIELDGDGEIIRSYGTLQDITDRKQAEEHLNFQASHDALTGLVNRYEFERRTRRLLATIRQDKAEHALCYMDLDQFKIVNDTCGHAAGDALLQQLSALLRQEVRKRDTLARLGGDEFGVLMEHCSLEHAQRVAGSLLTAIQSYQFTWEGHSFKVGASIGLVAITQEASPNLSQLMKQVDAACYMAKDLGRNRVHVYREEDASLAQRHGEMQWVTRIYRAQEEKRFCLYAQTIVPLDSSKTKHYELLIRMKDEEGKLIPPGAFLPAAERYDLMPQIDRWVIEQAFSLLAQNPVFQQQIHFVSINLSGQSLADETFQDFVIDKLKANNISPARICFEITETTAISNLHTAVVFISRMKALGCQFALDDFGSGLSSFAYLKNLPVDYLKIDGMFVKDIVDDPIDHAMVKSINEIGHVMGMKTIAEFVENDVIKGMLKEIGVDYAQGYGIGKPQPFDELLARSNNVTDIKNLKDNEYGS